MITIQDVVDRVTFITKDIDHDRWSVSEIIQWINEAIDIIVKAHPRAAAQYVTLSLGAGARQDLRLIDASKQWVRLHSILCNMNGNAPAGTPVRLVPASALDSVSPTWRSAAQSGSIKEYVQDEREPFTFDVNPPAIAGTKVHVLASVKPQPVAAADTFPLASGYDIPTVDYVLYRVFSKDANDQAYATRAAAHLQAFQLAMNVETSGARPA